MNTVNSLIASLKEREEMCWNMTWVFYSNRDAHGVHDMGVEIQALQRARIELEKLEEDNK